MTNTTSVKTNSGRKLAINRTYKAIPDYTALSKFKVGSGNADATKATTGLDDAVPITGTESIDQCDSTTGWTAGTDTAVALNTSTYKQGSGSLSIAKTGTTGTTFEIHKTVGSLDFTSKQLYAWVYITSTADLAGSGTAFEIRYGQSNTQYWSKAYTAAQLQNGWNLIRLANGDMTGTGSPTLTGCVYVELRFSVAAAANTVAANRILADELRLVSADDYIKAFDSITIDEVNMEVRIRCMLLSTEANGRDLNAIGLQNTDASPLMGSVDTMANPETKDPTDEFVWDIRERFV